MTPLAPRVAAADADDHQRLRVAADLCCGGLNPGKFRPVIIAGQMDPASELAAKAAAGLQFLVGFFQAGHQGFLIGKRQKRLRIEQLNIQHTAHPFVRRNTAMLQIISGRGISLCLKL